jgi:nicotinamidase/pyrazinamidase
VIVMALRPTPQDALIVVDVQNDFLPGGALAVAHGDEVVLVINRLLPMFTVRAFTRDWHPPNHISFSPRPKFADRSWPAHCVQHTRGAQFAPNLLIDPSDHIVNKGDQPALEAYSGFQGTDLREWLTARGIRRVFVAGLATDYCVKTTALDALAAGFHVVVVTDAIQAVDVPPGNGEQAVAQMRAAGVSLISFRELTDAR